MKKRILKIIVAFVFIMSFGTQQVGASSGKLKGASIVNCGGQNYGHHGDGHWHRATKHDAGWYPDGDNLGYNNPCSSSAPAAEQPPAAAPSAPAPSAPRSVEKSQQQIAEEKRVQEELELKKKLAKEEEERLAAIEAAEKEKLRLEELEKERLREIELKDTTIEKTLIGGALILGSSDTTVISKDDLDKIEVKPSNALGTVETKLESDEVVFENNKVIISITSEDKEATEDYSYPIFIMGNADELLDQKISLLYAVGNEKAIEEVLTQNVIDLGTMSQSGIDKLVFSEVIINDHKFDLVEPTLNKIGEGEYELNFEIQGIAYALPIMIEEEKANLVPAGVAVSGVAAGSYYIFTKKKKTKQAEKT